MSHHVYRAMELGYTFDLHIREVYVHNDFSAPCAMYNQKEDMRQVSTLSTKSVIALSCKKRSRRLNHRECALSLRYGTPQEFAFTMCDYEIED